MRGRVLTMLLATVLLATVLLGVTLFAAWPAGAASAVVPGTPAAEADFSARIDALRARHGLAPLQVHDELTATARRWAGAMTAAGAISHNENLPNEVSADWETLGENVGVGGDTASIFAAFADSPSHYRNLIDPAFTHVGIGVVHGADGSLYTAHHFMRLPGGGATTVELAATSRVTAAPPPAAVADTAPAAPALVVLALEQVRAFAATRS